tara:strand:+ start:1062 stop:1433 length:372 start_codon:yes stop_codon:yes gene_type:complete
MKVFQEPDTDSRLIKVVDGSTNVTPNLMHDHTRFEYVCPTANSQAVAFNTPIKTEDRGLHWIVIDNSNNTVSKVFTFSPDYVFLDDLANTTNTYTMNPTKKLVWFCTWTANKMYLRLASESTN